MRGVRARCSLEQRLSCDCASAHAAPALTRCVHRKQLAAAEATTLPHSCGRRVNKALVESIPGGFVVVATSEREREAASFSRAVGGNEKSSTRGSHAEAPAGNLSSSLVLSSGCRERGGGLGLLTCSCCDEGRRFPTRENEKNDERRRLPSDSCCHSRSCDGSLGSSASISERRTDGWRTSGRMRGAGTAVSRLRNPRTLMHARGRDERGSMRLHPNTVLTHPGSQGRRLLPFSPALAIRSRVAEPSCQLQTSACVQAISWWGTTFAG